MVKTFTLRKELILIELKHISKVYEGANRVEALKDINPVSYTHLLGAVLSATCWRNGFRPF